MTTNLKDMTVEELRDLALSISEAAEHAYKIQRSMLPFNELARRLEEAQQEIKRLEQEWRNECRVELVVNALGLEFKDAKGITFELICPL